MQVIIEEMARQKIDPRTTSLKVGIFAPNPGPRRCAARSKARLRIDAVDIYGLSEVMGPGVASECIESKDAPPVVWEDHFLPEIIDPGDRRGAARRQRRRARVHGH